MPRASNHIQSHRMACLIMLSLTAYMLVTCFCAASPAEISRHPEKDVEAAFIYNFTKFIKWREHKDSVVLVIGYWGTGTLLDALKMLHGKKTQGKIIHIKQISHYNKIDQVDVLIIENLKHIDEKIIKELARKNILTIAEGPDAVEKGAIIGLYKKYNRIRFAINLKKAKASKLIISSRLLKLAQPVIK